jgi:Ca2+-binding RTX toxin-like protein
MSNIGIWTLADGPFIAPSSFFLDRIDLRIDAGADYVNFSLKDQGRIAVLSGTFTSTGGIVDGTISRYSIQSSTIKYDVVVSGIEGLTLGAFVNYVQTNTTSSLLNAWLAQGVTFVGNVTNSFPTTLTTSSGNDYISGGGGPNFINAGNGNNVVVTYDLNDTILCGSGNDKITAGSGNDFVDAGGGNDTIDGGKGNDTIEGGSGIDTFILAGTRAEHTITNNSVVWNFGSSASGADTLSNVERVKFSDLSLAIDINSSNSAGGIYRLYNAAFNRAPDLVGLGFWIDQSDKGKGTVAIATEFVNSAEFQKLFATKITDEYATGANVTALVTGFYTNVLHRAPDAVGRDWYANQITERQKTVGQVLAEIADSPENVAQLAGVISNGIAYIPWGG